MSGAPAVLILVCLLQIGLLVTSVAVSQGSLMCSVRAESNHTVRINCDDCVHENELSFGSLGLFLAGLFLVSVGIVASVWRSQRIAQAYGMLMVILAFVSFAAFVLELLGEALIADARDHVDKGDASCVAHANAMLSATRVSIAMYFLNGALAACGALFAVRSRAKFAFDAVLRHHAEFHKSYGTL